MHAITTSLLLALSLASSKSSTPGPSPASAQGSRALPRGAGQGEAKALVFLKAREEGEKLVIHYRASKWMDLIVLRTKRNLSRTIRNLEKKLGKKCEGKFHVFLYRDRHELSNLGRIHHGPKRYIRSTFLHAVFDQELEEDIAKILLQQWIPTWRKPDEARQRPTSSASYGFLLGGMALSLTSEKINGVSIRDWIAFYDRLDPLPDISTLESSFPRHRSKAPASWIAASWIGYLIQSQGLEKVQRYCATADCEGIFGKQLGELGSAWELWLHQPKSDLVATALRGFDDAVAFRKDLTGIQGRVRLKIAGDDRFLLFHNGAYKGGGHTWYEPTRLSLDLTGKDRIEIVVINQGSAGGLLLELVDGKGKVLVQSDKTWSARRAETERKPARVLGPPLSGAWLAFLSDARKPPIRAMRGSWIWDS